jgi:hypothetical protein
MSENLKKAVKTLTDEIQKDKDYRESWKANIAMAYIDAEKQYREETRKAPNALNGQDKHTIANNAADNFLTMLCK